MKVKAFVCCEKKKLDFEEKNTVRYYIAVLKGKSTIQEFPKRVKEKRIVPKI
jgi:hypothetical protein